MKKINDYDYYIYQKLIQMSKKCLKSGDVPVAAIIVQNQKIVGKGINKREKQNNIINHAEIMAIEKANKCLKTWNLSNCVMYVTLKPCTMCENVIKQARIKQVFYLIEKPINKKEYNKTIFTKSNCLNLEKNYLILLANFFKKLRK